MQRRSQDLRFSFRSGARPARPGTPTPGASAPLSFPRSTTADRFGYVRNERRTSPSPIGTVREFRVNSRTRSDGLRSAPLSAPGTHQNSRACPWTRDPERRRHARLPGGNGAGDPCVSPPPATRTPRTRASGIANGQVKEHGGGHGHEETGDGQIVDDHVVTSYTSSGADAKPICGTSSVRRGDRGSRDSASEASMAEHPIAFDPLVSILANAKILTIQIGQGAGNFREALVYTALPRGTGNFGLEPAAGTRSADGATAFKHAGAWWRARRVRTCVELSVRGRKMQDAMFSVSVGERIDLVGWPEER
jgi:hypothetical protein